VTAELDREKSAPLQGVDQQDQKLILRTINLDLQKLDLNLVRLEAQQLETALAEDKAKAKL
jgi:hypothetical protein